MVLIVLKEELYSELEGRVCACISISEDMIRNKRRGWGRGVLMNLRLCL